MVCRAQALARGTAVVALAVLTTAPALAQEVNIYSARHYDSDDQLYAMFEEETGIAVNVIEGDSDQLIERIAREGEASPADILITVDAGRLWRAQDAGIFAEVDSEVLNERIPEELREPTGKWYAFSQRMRLIYYNKESVGDDHIATYEELGSPDLDGNVCIRSSTNIYNQSLVASRLYHLGAEETESWLEGLVDNMARDPEGGDTDQIRGAATGECDYAVANHYYWVRLHQSDDPTDQQHADAVGLIFPNQETTGAHVNVGGAGVVRNAPNHDNAVAFLEFLSSDEAQQHFAVGNSEFPVVDGVDAGPVLAEWGDIQTDDVNVSVLGRYNPEAVRMMDRAGWR